MPRETAPQTTRTRYRIIRFLLNEEDEAAPFARIDLQRTLIDSEDGESDLGDVMHFVRGTALATAMASVTSGGTIYDEMKALLYAQCVADGVVPENATDV